MGLFLFQVCRVYTLLKRLGDCIYISFSFQYLTTNNNSLKTGRWSAFSKSDEVLLFIRIHKFLYNKRLIKKYGTEDG